MSDCPKCGRPMETYAGCLGCGYQPVKSELAEPSGSAKFVVQRPEYPDWWAGWNEYNLPSWTSHPGYAYLVRADELVDTLTRLAKHKPIAALYSPNAELSHGGDSER